MTPSQSKATLELRKLSAEVEKAEFDASHLRFISLAPAAAVLTGVVGLATERANLELKAADFIFGPQVARVIRRTAETQRDQMIFLVIAQPSAAIPVMDLRAL